MRRVFLSVLIHLLVPHQTESIAESCSGRWFPIRQGISSHGLPAVSTTIDVKSMAAYRRFFRNPTYIRPTKTRNKVAPFFKMYSLIEPIAKLS